MNSPEISIHPVLFVVVLSFGFVLAGSGSVVAAGPASTPAHPALAEPVSSAPTTDAGIASETRRVANGGQTPLVQVDPPGQTKTPANGTPDNGGGANDAPGQQTTNEPSSDPAGEGSQGPDDATTGSEDTTQSDGANDPQGAPNDGANEQGSNTSTGESENGASGQAGDSGGPPETGGNGSASDTDRSPPGNDANASGGSDRGSGETPGPPDTPGEGDSAAGESPTDTPKGGNGNDTGPPTWVDSPEAPGNDRPTGPPAVPPGPPNGTSHTVSVGPENVTVTVSRGPPDDTPGSRVAAHVGNATPNAPIPVELPSAANGSVKTDQLTLTVTERQNVSLGVTTRESRDANRTPAFTPPAAAEGIGYISVDHTVPDEEIENVTFQFSVDSDRISASEREDIALYRHHNGSWNEVPTTYVDRNETAYVFEARSPGLSEFSVGKKIAKFEIQQANLLAEAHTTADPVGVRVRITNQGGADGIYTAKLLLDAEERARNRLSIAAGGTRQTSFTENVEEPGQYTVLVNNFTVGTLQVDPVTKTTAGSTASETGSDSTEGVTSKADATGDEATSTTNIETPGFAAGTALASLLLVVAVLHRRVR